MSNSPLHLPDLSISGFRGINDVSISQFGRVTLFAGENGIGKTTLLDAIRIYASRGRYYVIEKILRDREEIISVDDGDDELLLYAWKALFHGWGSQENTTISIGPTNGSQKLCLKVVPMVKTDIMNWGREGLEYFPGEDNLKLSISFDNFDQAIPLSLLHERRKFPHSKDYLEFIRNFEDLPETTCETVGPELLNNKDMARFWDQVALTDNEQHVVQALRLIFDRVEGITMVGNGSRAAFRGGRRSIVKIKDQESPIPLKSLGDGAVRLFGVALALASSKDGFLLIDEAENGIHHTVQRRFWKMILTMAQERNVQVFATTHSWDCVMGFAQASHDLPDVDGRLVRLERDDKQVRTVEYSEDELDIATKQRIEVR